MNNWAVTSMALPVPRYKKKTRNEDFFLEPNATSSELLYLYKKERISHVHQKITPNPYALTKRMGRSTPSLKRFLGSLSPFAGDGDVGVNCNSRHWAAERFLATVVPLVVHTRYLTLL